MRALAAFRRRTGGPRPVPIALVAALALAAAALPLPARAATLTVNSAADTDARDAWLTLREAILVGNGNGSLALSSLTADEQRQVVGALANPGLNTILFDPGIARVDVGAGGLPTVENPIEIDGGGSVVLAGAAAGVGANGLWIKAGGSTVRGLVIQGFTGSGILLTDGGDNHLEGNRIGATGANGYGVTISDSPGNTVGGQRTLPGPCAAPCNLISGNTTDGILIYGPRATGNFVQGNFIGTDVDGTSPLGNGYGVFVTKLVGVAGAPARNVIGGRNATPWTACTGACNLISGNQGYGVLLLFSGEEGNAVQGNFIGPDVNGKAKVDALEHPLGNALSGVLVSATGAAAGSAPNNTVGGEAAAEGNLISGNGHDGVNVNAGGKGTRIWGNRIGTDVTGLQPLGNGRDGVGVLGPSGVAIGGARPGRPCTGRCNLISGNGRLGVHLHRVDDTLPTRDNDVLGNFIGTDLDGRTAIANALAGVDVEDAPDNRIGGAAAGPCSGACNLVAGNGGHGVVLVGKLATGNRVRGNSIGVALDGETPLPNALVGVLVTTPVGSPTEGASENWIGGAGTGEGNVISGNGLDGVEIVLSATDNRVLGNRIGTDRSGKQKVGNTGDGVYVSGSGKNSVGGPRPIGSEVCEGPCNLIGGNTKNGVRIATAGADDNHVEGNFIGVDTEGLGELPNGRAGVLVHRGAKENFVGGARETGSRVCDGPCNVIAGNTGAGIAIVGAGRTHVEGNFIGVTPDGGAEVHNGTQGVFLSDRAAAEVDGAIDPEAAYAMAAGLDNNKPWPLEVDAHAVACEIQARLAGGSQESGFLNWQGFLFEVLATQEYGWVRSATPGTRDVDAVEVDATDPQGRRWQMKSKQDVTCGWIAGMLPENPGPQDVWGLLVPGDITIPDCADPARAERVRKSGSLARSLTLSRIAAFLAYARAKTDCTAPAAPQETSGNVIGGVRGSAACDGPCNVIAGNREVGVALDGAATMDNAVQGNYIGLAPTDDALTAHAVPNEIGGVRLHNAPVNVIGGERPAAACSGPCNVISGNALTGVLLYGPTANFSRVEGNYVGVQPSGAAPLRNTLAGVAIENGAARNTIGGTARSTACDGTCNLIGGNGTDGVLIWGPTAAGNEVQGNYVGAAADGLGAIPNGHHGVAIEEGASSTVVGIGGTDPLLASPCAGPCNVLRNNGETGIAVIGDNTLFNTLRDNAVYGNGGLPIDLAGDGPTPNDQGDSDPGPNGRMSYPRLQLRVDDSLTTRISGTLDTPNPDQAVVEVYEGDQADPARLLGSLHPDAAGKFALPPIARRVADAIAMATDGSGSSSELSPSLRRPLVFIPGAAGSTLVDRGHPDDELWLGLGTDHRRLSLFSADRDGNAQIVATDVLRPIYGPLLDKLVEGGYREYRRTEAECDLSQKAENPTLFVFAYDWRLDLAQNAERLRDYVSCIRRFYPDGGIDLLAHSLGGLLARRYLLDHPADHGVRKLITVATPFLGLPKTIDVLETGDFSFLQPLFRETGRYIAGSFTGVHQTLPSQAYYGLVDRLPDGSPSKLYPLAEAGWDFDGKEGSFDVYPYDRYVSAVDARYGRDDSPQQQHEYFPASAAQLFHRPAQDDWSAGGTGVEIHHLYGIDPWDVTIGQLRAIYGVECARVPLPKTCVPARTFFPIWTRGDGTVPLLSAERCVRPNGDSSCADPGLNDPAADLIPIAGSPFALIDGLFADHLLILRNPDVQALILRFLTGGETGASRARAQARSLASRAALPTPAPAFRLILTGAAPVVVSDDAGHTTTPSAEAPGGTLLEAHVHALGEATEAVALPASGAYTVTFQATARPMGIELTLGTRDRTTLAIRYRDLALPPGVTARLRLTPAGPEDLRYDADGDGTFETAVAPTAAVSGEAANDREPPIVSASWQEQTGALVATLAAQDAGSGVKALYWSLDGSTFQPYSGPFPVDPIASPVLWAFADDGVANRGVLVVRPPAADLSLTASAPTAVPAGASLAYTFTVTDRGPLAADGAVVRVTLPAELAGAACAATGGGVCAGTGGERTVTFPTLAAGATATVTLTATVGCAIADGTLLTARATVGSAVFDPRPADNAAAASASAANVVLLDPTAATFSALARSADVRVTAPAGCPWTTVSGAPFLKVTWGSGSGPGMVQYRVDANRGSDSRTGTLTIAGKPFVVTQEGVPCDYALTRTSQLFGPLGGEGGVGIETPIGCTWTAASDAAWITITAVSSGIRFSVAPNLTTAPRTATLTVAGRTFTVRQEGLPCTYTVTPGSPRPAGSSTVGTAAGAGAAAAAGRETSRALQPASSPPARAAVVLAAAPLAFVANRGQLPPEVAYAVQGRDKTLYFTARGVLFALTGTAAPRRWVVALDFLGARPDVRPAGRDPVPAVVSYFKGPRESWRVGLPTFGSLVYPDLWPGIDLVFAGTASHLEYSFVVRPGADPRGIRLAYRGASSVALDGAGRLAVASPVAGFTDEEPHAYQEIDGRRVEVAAAYALGGGSADAGQAFRFDIGAYDPDRALVIDPAVLVYCGYIGGDGPDTGNAIAVDRDGYAYVAGYTWSPQSTFPVRVGPDLTHNGGYDAFVAKVAPDGKSLVYLGYLGGAGLDWATGIAVDAAGNAYVAGFTSSTEATFPVRGGPDLTYSGGPYDAFVAKVNAAGTGLDYAGYLGGAGDDRANGIAVDAAGAAYVVGSTDSAEASFPVRVGPDLTYNGGGDVFVAKIAPDGQGLLYLGYLGGTGDDRGLGIAVDEAGNAYVAGSTASSEASFPVRVGPDLTYNGGPQDAFVARVNAAGTGLDYAGYIGGAGGDVASGIAVDAAGAAYVVGSTDSSEASFPVRSGPDLTYNGGGDAFTAKVRPDGAGLVYAGYIGGSDGDGASGVAVDADGRAYVAGAATIEEFPHQPFPAPLDHQMEFSGLDAFVARVNAAGTGLDYGLLLGGRNDDWGGGVAVDAGGNAYVTGGTESFEGNLPPFPVRGGPDLTHSTGGADAFVAKIADRQTDLEVRQTATPDLAAAGDAVTWTITVVNNGPGAASLATLTAELPPALTVVSCAATGGGVCGGAGAVRTVRFSALAADAVETVTLVTRPAGCFTGLLTARASIRSSTPDADPSDDAATAAVTALAGGAAITPASQSFAASGGAGHVSVAVPAGCAWSAVSQVPWLTVTAGGGTGDGAVTYAVAPHTGLAPRTGTLVIAGRILTVTQVDRCSVPIAFGQTVNGVLTATDCAGWGGPGPADRYSFQGLAGQTIQAAKSSPTFRTDLSLFDPNGNLLRSTIGAGFSVTLAATQIYVIQLAADPGSSVSEGPYTLTLGEDAFCKPALAPANASFAAAGGAGSVALTVQNARCAWRAVSDSPWLVVTAGTTGTGSGTLSYVVFPFAGLGTRTGTIAIGGQAFPVTQSAAPVSAVSFPAAGGSGEVQVASAGGCPWTAASGVDWLTVTSGASGIGNGTATYTVAPNPGAVPRTAVLTAAGVAVEVRQEPGGADLYTVPPCRVLDTRLPTDGPALAAGTERVFPVAGLCGIPATARAVSLNVTVAAPTDRGHLRLYPGDTPTPTASTINYLTGQNRANNAIVPLGADGTLAVFCGQSAGTTHVVVDVNGYFQ